MTDQECIDTITGWLDQKCFCESQKEMSFLERGKAIAEAMRILMNLGIVTKGHIAGAHEWLLVEGIIQKKEEIK